MREAFDSYWRMCEDNGNMIPTDVIDYFVLHTPYPNLVKHAAAMLIRHELRHVNRWKDTIENLHSIYDGEKTIEEIFSDKETFEKDYKLRKEIMKTDEFKRFYETKIEPGMRVPSEVGNSYTASIFLSLISLLEIEGRKDRLKEGQKVAFGGYGSGAGALGYQGIVQDGFKGIVDKLRIEEKLNNREKMSVGEYEVTRILDWGTKKYGEYKGKYGETAKRIAKIGVEKAVELIGKVGKTQIEKFISSYS
jgi:hydroxymethylglutaryl-CoA synthase